MFVFIRRHQAWGLVFIAAVILSFVVFFSPYSKLQGRGGGGSGDYGSIDGRTVSADEFHQGQKEARLEFLLRNGSWPEDAARSSGYDAVRQAMDRVFLLRKLKQLAIEPSDKAVADQIAEYFRDKERGTFDLQNYENFVQQRLLRAGVSKQDFQEFVRHEVGASHLMSVAGISGELVTPREAEANFRKENEQTVAELVVFQTSNYLAQVTVDPAAVEQHFTNRQAAYRIPERVQVSYITFASSNYLAEANEQMAKETNFNQRVDAEYQQRGAAFFKDDQGNPLTEVADKEKMRQDITKQVTFAMARRNASAFANSLFAKEPARADELDKLAAASNYVVNVTAPFTVAQGPSELEVNRAFGEKVAKLTPEAPFATPVISVDQDAVYIVALKQRIPSSIPPFENVREMVTTDYRNTQARDLVREAGSAFYTSLTNGLAQGKTFETVCAEANVTPLKPAPFANKTSSLPETDQLVSVFEMRSAASTLTPGKAGAFTPSRVGGYILFLKSRLPVAEEQLKTELPAHIEEIRRQRQYAAFNDWFTKELEHASLKMPAGYKSAN